MRENKKVAIYCRVASKSRAEIKNKKKGGEVDE